MYTMLKHGLVALALLGCGFAGNGGDPQPSFGPADSTNATIYIYRSFSNDARFVKAKVLVDGSEVATLANDRYFYLTIPAGHHIIVCNPKKSTVGVDVKPGTAYFVQIMMDSKTFTLNPAEAFLVQEDRGISEMSKMKAAIRFDLKADFAHTPSKY